MKFKVKRRYGRYRVPYPSTLRSLKNYKKFWKCPSPHNRRYRYRWGSYAHLVSAVMQHQRQWERDAREWAKEDEEDDKNED